MSDGYGYITEALCARQTTSTFTKITVGEVVDTNDPQQMGRLRILCPALGDSAYNPLGNLPWAAYVAPFGGITNSGTKGRDEHETTGPTSYGMWNIPKVGSTVLVACIDGDVRFRVWLGCLYGQFLPHTMPHGRFSYRAENEQPAGPLSSEEEPIQPLHSELTLAFSKSKDTTNTGSTNNARSSFEFRTRGSDYSVAAIDAEIINSTDSQISQLADDQDVTISESDGNEINVTQGYAESRVDPPFNFENTNKNYDSQTYSWTTPGFHGFSMDDRAENCRIRIRTTHGHQIIMDDTNERMYISTPQGDSWIELDEKGNIDIYGKRNISVHAEKSINMTADETFRVKAKNIHFAADEDVRIHSKGGDGLQMKGSKVHIESTSGMHIKSATLFLQSTGGELDIKSGGAMKISSELDMFLNGGPNVHLNPGTNAASNADSAVEAFWTSRVPEHEPWARVMTKPESTDQNSNNTHTNAAEYSYDDKNVGRKERGEDLTRNSKWHR